MPSRTARCLAVTRIYLRKSIAVAAASSLAIFFAQVGAGSHGGGGAHGGFGPAIGHGSYGGHFHGFYGHGLHRDFHNSSRHDRFDRHFALHDFGHWDGHGTDGHFGRWHPGHWQAASGF